MAQFQTKGQTTLHILRVKLPSPKNHTIMKLDSVKMYLSNNKHRIEIHCLV